MAKKSQKTADNTVTIDAFLDAFLTQASFTGWSHESLTKTAESLGTTELETKRLFPEGVADITQAFHDHINSGLQSVDNIPIRERIKALVLNRIALLEPHKDAMIELTKWYSTPAGSALAATHLWDAAHVMWRLAGDTSTDYNFYTKRALLSGVYGSTILFWLNDDSQNNQKTDEFLQDRIDNVMQINQLRSKLDKVIDQFNPLANKPGK